MDALSQPGLVIAYPPSQDSFFGDLGGLRDTLADRDMTLVFRSTNSFLYDVAQNNRPNNPQIYNGQKFTVATFSPHFVFTAGLDNLGLKNGKFILSAISLHSSWKPTGPSETAIRVLAYYQSFFDDRLEIKAGYTPNLFEFVGVFTAGSPTLASGLNGVLPIQAGLSADPVTAPTFNVTLNGKNGTYFKGGIQRSRSPAGADIEAEHNHFGLRFSAARSKALYIGEAGIKRRAGAGSKQLWLRAGILYNTSDYTRFADGTYANNKSVYVLGDGQISQIDPVRPHRGLYAGGTAIYADPKVNAYTQFYEGRIYGIGLMGSRPNDTIALGVNATRFSGHARRFYTAQAVPTVENQFSVALTYSAHVTKGIYASPSLTYIHNAAFATANNDALNAGLTIFTQF